MPFCYMTVIESRTLKIPKKNYPCKKIYTMEKESVTFAEWFNGLTTPQAANLVLLVSFVIIILILVIRTFRGRSNA